MNKRIKFLLFSFLPAGLAVAFLWFTRERLAPADQVAVSQAQLLPDKPHTRGRIP